MCFFSELLILIDNCPPITSTHRSHNVLTSVWTVSERNGRRIKLFYSFVEKRQVSAGGVSTQPHACFTASSPDRERGQPAAGWTAARRKHRSSVFLSKCLKVTKTHPESPSVQQISHVLCEFTLIHSVNTHTSDPDCHNKSPTKETWAVMLKITSASHLLTFLK